MLDDRDSETPQLAFIADARLHQHLGRMHGTKRQDDLPSRSDAMERAVARNLHSRGAPGAERESGHQGAREDREVRPIHVWEYVRSEHRLPSAVADAHIGSRATAFRFHHATVWILKEGDSGGADSFEQRLADRLRVRLRLNEHRSTRSAIRGIRRAMPIFDASIRIEHRFVTPGAIAGLRCEEVPIAPGAARPDHG